MAQNKQLPWLDELLEGDLFKATSEDIELALSMREQFDYDCGTRIKGEAIRTRAWFVGFLREGAIDDNSPIERFFEELRRLGETEILAIPAKTASYEYTGVHDVVDSFTPPLVAKTDPTLASYLRIRSSLVQMLRGSFFVFSKNEQGALLSNSGKYAMFAGPRDLVARAIGTDIDSSWSAVRSNSELDPLVLYRLRAALAAYGL